MPKCLSLLFCCLLLLVGYQHCAAQQSWLSLKVAGNSGGDSEITTLSIKKKPLPTLQRFDHIGAAFDYLKDLVGEMRENGYLAISVDSFQQADSVLTAWLYVGKRYQWASLSFANIPVAFLNTLNLRIRDWQGQHISPRRLAVLSEQMLAYCENNGYPFAQTHIENIRGEEGGLHGDLILDKGMLMKFDSLTVETDVAISKTFLQNYLGIQEGDPYNESLLRTLSKKLSELSFLQESRPWQMDFSIAKSRLRLYLKEKKANQLNGLVGLQPNTAATGKFLLTYDILLGLKNALGYGETIAATIQRLQYKTLRFHGDAALPYLFGTLFGVEGSFDLFNRDTSFVRISFDGGLRYQLNASDYVKISYQSLSNRIIDADVRYVQLNKRLPENLDITTRGAGMVFHMDRTNYKLNPRSGWQGRLLASGLLRQVKKNDAIIGIEDGSGFNYAGLYDTLNNKKYQYRFQGEAAYYFTPLKNMVIKIGYNGGYISGEQLFLNELYQLGGFKLLRGFDEQSIYANQYHVATLELRFLLGQNSYFYIFNDDAYVFTQYGLVNRKDYPVSLGGGITLENKSGIFNIALGLGKRSGTNFQFKQTRIHFGYTAYF